MKDLYVPYKEIKDEIAYDYTKGETQPSNIEMHKAMKILDIVDKSYEKHIMKMPIYVSVAYRYGNREAHSYPAGLFRTLEEAIADAEDHYSYRAGKYDIVIYKSDFSGNQEEVFDYGEYSAAKVRINFRNKDETAEEN